MFLTTILSIKLKYSITCSSHYPFTYSDFPDFPKVTTVFPTQLLKTLLTITSDLFNFVFIGDIFTFVDILRGTLAMRQIKTMTYLLTHYKNTLFILIKQIDTKVIN